MTAAIEPVQPLPPAGPDTTVEASVDRLLEDRSLLAVTLDHYAAAFTTLSRLLLTAPTAYVLARVRDPELLDEWPLLMDADCRRGTALLAESAVAGEKQDVVHRDYNRLFVGPERMKAPPYESVHRSEEHLLFEAETMEVRAAYAAFGLAAPRLNKEPDDHIGLELSFAAALCERAMDALESRRDDQLRRLLGGLISFLADHLLVWAPRCLTQAANASTTFFYQGVAALGLGTLTSARATFLA